MTNVAAGMRPTARSMSTPTTPTVAGSSAPPTLTVKVVRCVGRDSAAERAGTVTMALLLQRREVQPGPRRQRPDGVEVVRRRDIDVVRRVVVDAMRYERKVFARDYVVRVRDIRRA